MQISEKSLMSNIKYNNSLNNQKCFGTQAYQFHVHNKWQDDLIAFLQFNS